MSHLTSSDPYASVRGLFSEDVILRDKIWTKVLHCLNEMPELSDRDVRDLAMAVATEARRKFPSHRRSR
jgi:hypothetical protein